MQIGMKSLLAVLIVSSLGAFKIGEETAENRLAARKQQVKEIQRAAGPWAAVAKSTVLGEGELLRQVSIRSSLGEFSDPQCLIYTNANLKTAAIVCPGADQIDLIDLVP